MTRDRFWPSLFRRVPLRGGLRRRILFWFLVLSLVPLLVSNTVGYFYAREIMERQMRGYLRALVETQARQVANEVERHQLFLDGISVSGLHLLQASGPAAVQVRRLDRSLPELQMHLAHELLEIRSLSELFVIDTTGKVIGATNSERLGEDWSLRWPFRRGRSDHYFAVDWDKRDGSVVPVYLLAVPIRDGRQRVIGVLGGTVGFDKLREFLSVPEHLATDVHSFIVDRYGYPVFVSHPHIPIDYRKPLPSPLVGQAPGAAARYVNYDGVEVIGMSVPVSGVPWVYISEVSVASALGQLRGLALLAATLESVFALLLVAIVWIVARSIVAPLRRLVVAAERIREGDLGAKVEIDRDDELGDLGRTFDQMSSELESSARKIHELHEQDMRRAGQLASVGELASGIAHEIKNPLIGMASGVDLLSRRIEKDAKSAALLEQINAQVARIESAIRDLLSYASPKEPKYSWTDPKLLLQRLITLVHPQADAAGVRVDGHHGEELPTIRVDPELLTQALVNLALNAIQSMESGGTLQVSVERAGDEVRFSISDTGVGIAPEEIDRIYRPFYTTKHRGTGLGLAITRGIVERHGGRMEIESELGEGSKFNLIIPVKAREAVPP